MARFHWDGLCAELRVLGPTILTRSTDLGTPPPQCSGGRSTVVQASPCGCHTPSSADLRRTRSPDVSRLVQRSRPSLLEVQPARALKVDGHMSIFLPTTTQNRSSQSGDQGRLRAPRAGPARGSQHRGFETQEKRKCHCRPSNILKATTHLAVRILRPG
jgi:hypothetical protein